MSGSSCGIEAAEGLVVRALYSLTRCILASFLHSRESWFSTAPGCEKTPGCIRWYPRQRCTQV